MLEKQKKDLDKAKDLFFSWKLHDAYAIFRRFFDRLPFSPQAEHAHFLSYFIRCLLELGKERELNFYLNQVEKLSLKWKTPELDYQLAEVYILGNSKNLGIAKSLLTQLISNTSAKHLHTKAKMLLAFCYDCEGDSINACRRIIDSIEEISDRPTQLNVELWRIKILRDEGKGDLARVQLEMFLKEIDLVRDWYAFFTAKILLGGLMADQGEKDQANQLLMETMEIAEKSPFKTIKAQLKALEEKINSKKDAPSILCEQGINGWKLSCNQKSVELKHQTMVARIFELFIKTDRVEKSQMAKKIFQKQYEPMEDDNKVHFQIHSLRRLLQDLDFESDPICFEDGAYRLIPKVIIHEGEV